MTGPIIGIDPGGTTGLAVFVDDSWHLAQVTPELVTCALVGFADRWGLPELIAVEAFVVGPRAARSSTPEGGRIARELIAAVGFWGLDQGVRVVLRKAADVKPWATDKRLAAAGVPDIRGMPHARDAARHALYAGVRDLDLPDPLSSTHRSPR